MQFERLAVPEKRVDDLRLSDLANFVSASVKLLRISPEAAKGHTSRLLPAGWPARGWWSARPPAGLRRPLILPVRGMPPRFTIVYFLALYDRYKHPRPVRIGIGGPVGSGKTMLLLRLIEALHQRLAGGDHQ